MRANLQRAEKEALALEVAQKEVRRIKLERGEDEDEKGEDDAELLKTALAVARAAEGLVPTPDPLASPLSPPPSARPASASGGWGGGGGEGEEAAAATAAAAAAAAATAAAAAPPQRVADPPPPKKRFTSVLFADSNTHVLVTGDTSGRVDVYRLRGIPESVGGEGALGGGLGALQAVLATIK